MTNIVRAIEKEKEYLAHRMKGEEPFHFADAIKEFGYETLEHYFAEKQDYEFGQLDFVLDNVPPNKAIAEIFRMMEARETKVLFVASEETFVFSGIGKEFNQEYCVENNIPIYLFSRDMEIMNT